MALRLTVIEEFSIKKICHKSFSVKRLIKNQRTWRVWIFTVLMKNSHKLLGLIESLCTLVSKNSFFGSVSRSHHPSSQVIRKMTRKTCSCISFYLSCLLRDFTFCCYPFLFNQALSDFSYWTIPTSIQTCFPV